MRAGLLQFDIAVGEERRGYAGGMAAGGKTGTMAAGDAAAGAFFAFPNQIKKCI